MPIVRLPKGELRDEIRQPVYDSWDLLGGVDPMSGYDFFSAVQGKSLIKTNLTQNRMFETAKSFRLQGLCLDAQNFRDVNYKVIPLVLERSSIRLKIGEKDYWTGPGRFAAGRMYQNAATTAGEFVYQQYGDQAVQPVILSGRHSVDINPLQQFVVEMRVGEMTAAEIVEATPEADTEIIFVFSLKGLLRRPVQ